MTNDQGVYTKILDLARPYLDTRCNDIHTAIAFQLARQLLECYPDADESVVLPAVILHDVGWKMIPEDKQLTAFGPNMADPELRRRHEQEGARIARGILDIVEYDPAKSAEVVAIIDGHDSRETALSLNDQLVKDADKLWRFTADGIEIDHLRFGFTMEDYCVWLGDQIDRWMFTAEAKLIARQYLTA